MCTKLDFFSTLLCLNSPYSLGTNGTFNILIKKNIFFDKLFAARFHQPPYSNFWKFKACRYELKYLRQGFFMYECTKYIKMISAQITLDYSLNRAYVFFLNMVIGKHCLQLKIVTFYPSGRVSDNKAECL